ncbi:MAG TPA: anaerobic ribonucleoside-triphosphate reductase [Syntrophus sp. (in: bacteria)]|jgi:ribonucleoside-triphosphate reductase|nr:anaerobic ribonucleoside-triphosphate reductase [Syntrophus sp. (in: bacteria)]
MIPPETTDMTLFVRTSGEEVDQWNRQRIVDTLIRETGIDPETATAISKDVEKGLFASGVSVLTTSLVRELVDAKLVERGLEKARRMHARLGFSLYDVDRLILHQNKEDANVPHGPEGTNLVLAQGIKREYALHSIFPQEISDAHILGDFHIHGLGYIDRPFAICQSLEYLKKYGLNLPRSLTVAKPAKHAEVLLAHMVRFGAILQGYFAGIISWNFVNLSFAPYLEGMSDREVRQLAQMLVYEFSQLTAARGGQAMFTDIHVFWEVPKSLRDLPMIGPAGESTGRTCGEYEGEAQRFAWALFDVFKKGDGTGKPFIFPRPIVHLTPRFFETSGHEDFLRHVCEAAAMGNPCFVLERKSEAEALYAFGIPASIDEMEIPWRGRFAAIQSISLNLPRLGYRAEGDTERLFKGLEDIMALAAGAHDQKRAFLERLLSYGDQGPLSALAMNLDGLPYLRMDRASYLLGMVGLNELVQIHTGKPIHESAESFDFGFKVIAFMEKQAGELSARHGIRMVLDQPHAETTSHRFARLDLRYFSPQAGRHVRGNMVNGCLYYTNSTHIPVSAPLKPQERVSMEGRFHPLIKTGAASQLWIGEYNPPAGDLAAFIIWAYRETNCRQLIFSPDFTTCLDCGKTTRGLKELCGHCSSVNVDGIAKITQYYSRVSDWNKGKLAELQDRFRQEHFA